MHKLLLPLLLLAAACTPAPPVEDAMAQPPIGGACDGCDLLYEGMPVDTAIEAEATLATAGEPGERLVLHGRVTGRDGLTPMGDVVVYAYHTDATGRYTAAAGQRDATRHGKLRGWVRTGADGRFTLNTIRPASYPQETIPAHVHLFVKEPGKEVYYIDDIRFTDDPLLSDAERAKAQGRGGDRTIALAQDSTGTWHGEVPIVLGLNIPDYR